MEAPIDTVRLRAGAEGPQCTTTSNGRGTRTGTLSTAAAGYVVANGEPALRAEIQLLYCRRTRRRPSTFCLCMSSVDSPLPTPSAEVLRGSGTQRGQR